jgi:hypothetical protein
MHLVLRLRGGYGGPPLRFVPPGMEMGIAAGGLIKQTIVQDDRKYEWDYTQTKVFNVQVLNSQHFQHVTGLIPPDPCINAATYAMYGYPFFSMYEEPTTVLGDFGLVQSVGQMNGIEEPSVDPTVVDISSPKHKTRGELPQPVLAPKAPRTTPGDACRAPRVEVEFFNPNGPFAKFRSVKEIEKELKGMNLF